MNRKEKYKWRLKVNMEGIRAYLKAYKIIERRGRKYDSEVLRVNPVLISLSLEKAFKALALFYERRKKLRGHNLLALWNSLSKKTRLEISNYVDDKPKYILRMLDCNQRAFETWRYIEEPQKNMIVFIDVHIMIDIINFTIKALEAKLSGSNSKK